MSVNILEMAATDHVAQATAGTDETIGIGECQFDGTVTEISIIPDGALTGDNTNNRVFTFRNVGQNGLGTTVIGTLTTTVAAGNWVAFDEVIVPLSGTPANLVVAAGDVFECVETHNGTGVAHPRMQIVIRGTHR